MSHPDAAYPPPADNTGKGYPQGPSQGYGTGYGAGYGYGTGPSNTEYAGVGRRIGGYVIDAIIYAVVINVLAIPLNMLGIAGAGSSATGVSVAALTTSLLGVVLGVVGFFVYFAGFTAFNKGQTPAKMLLGTKVVQSDSHGVPSLGQALGRYGLLYVMNLPCYLGSIVCACLMGNDPKIQGWHDKVANTVVLRLRNNAPF